MTNEQILKLFKKVIKKAVSNGFDAGKHFPPDQEDIDAVMYVREEIMLGIIFSHDFAKAIWGEKSENFDKSASRPMAEIAWQYNLQVMVLEPEPLKYLEKFL